MNSMCWHYENFYKITKNNYQLNLQVLKIGSVKAASSSKEIDTNKAYERIKARHDKWDDSKEILKIALADERMHKEWLDSNS